MKKLIVLASASVAAFCATAANVWYVDDDNYGKEGLDGTSKEKAYGTIQDAIDAATTEKGDTIKVYPGTYDKGGANLVIGEADCGACRVLARKSVTVESIEGAEKTHIVGEWDVAGRGPNAVRCIGQNGYTPTFKGFTLRNGATGCELNDKGNEADVGRNRGGAVYTHVGSNTYIVDCVVSNCNSSQGTFRNGCVIRSLVCYNMGIKGVGGMQTTFYSSIITGNKSGGSLISDVNASLSHCTVFGNETYTSVSGVTTAKNNIIFNSFSKSGGTDLSGASDATISGNALGLEHGEYQMIAPAAGDFRVLKGSVAETVCAGQPDDGAGLVRSVPEEYRGKDFYGNPIPENCVAGAVQGTAEAAGGALRFMGISFQQSVRVNGWRSTKKGAYLFPEKWPVQYLVKPVLETGKLYAWDTSGEHGDFYLPDAKTGVVYLMPPPQKGVVATNTMVLAELEIWVDPANGDDANAGTEEKPLRTLQKAVDAGSGKNTFAYCRAGTYAEGETESLGSLNRCVLGWNDIRFVALEGPEKTFIEGKASGNSPNSDQPGCGNGAVRGFCVNGSGMASVEGFTFRNCFTHSRAKNETIVEAHQGAVMRSTGNAFTILDCVIEDCAAASSVFCRGRIVRCKVSNLKNIGHVCDSTYASGCLFENNAGTTVSGVGFNCTFRNSGIFSGNYVCVASGGSEVPSGSACAGSIMHGFGAYSASGGYIADDPCFAAQSGAEILRSSPAFTCGEVPAADNYGTNYYKYASTDFFGRRLMFIDGKPVAGADHMGLFSMFWRRGFSVSPASGRVLEDGEGCVELPEGERISIAKEAVADAADRRRCVLRFVVPEGGSFSVKSGGEEHFFAPGIHEFVLGSLKDGIGETVLESVSGTVRMASLRYVSGTVVSLR